MSGTPIRIEPLTAGAPLVLPHEMGERAEKPSARGVTVVIPVYNEERGVEGVLERLSRLELGVPVALLAVNDGSKDGTGAVLAALARRFPRLRILTHRSNKGYGAALKTGFTHAKTDVVVITDADGTYPEDRIRDLVACIDDGAEMAVGARLGENVTIPLLRRPAKWVLRKLASFLAGTEIPDLNSGLRAFRRDLVLAYRPILPQGFSFTTTITLAALTNAHRVDYVPRRLRQARRQVEDPPDPRHAGLHRADHPHGALLQPAQGLLPAGRLRQRAARRVALLRPLRAGGGAQPGRQERAALRGADPDALGRPAGGPDREALALLARAMERV